MSQDAGGRRIELIWRLGGGCSKLFSRERVHRRRFICIVLFSLGLGADSLMICPGNSLLLDHHRLGRLLFRYVRNYGGGSLFGGVYLDGTSFSSLNRSVNFLDICLDNSGGHLIT